MIDQSKDDRFFSKIGTLRNFETLYVKGFISETDLDLILKCTNFHEIILDIWYCNDSQRDVLVSNIANTKLKCIRLIDTDLNQYIRPFIDELWKNRSICEVYLSENESTILEENTLVKTKSYAIICAITFENKILSRLYDNELKLCQIFFDTYLPHSEDHDHMMQLISRINYNEVFLDNYDNFTMNQFKRMTDIVLRINAPDFKIRKDPFTPSKLDDYYISDIFKLNYMENEWFEDDIFNLADHRDNYYIMRWD
jgi:hypothetical protein